MRYVFESFALDTDRRELKREYGSRFPGAASVRPIGLFDPAAALGRRQGRVDIGNMEGPVAYLDSALDARISAARLAVRDSGADATAHQDLPEERGSVRRNRDRRRGLCRREVPAGARDGPIAPPIPDRPSLAVLPFTNMSSTTRARNISPTGSSTTSSPACRGSNGSS